MIFNILENHPLSIFGRFLAFLFKNSQFWDKLIAFQRCIELFEHKKSSNFRKGNWRLELVGKVSD
jgi:hypothetical protein